MPMQQSLQLTDTWSRPLPLLSKEMAEDETGTFLEGRPLQVFNVACVPWQVE